MPVRKHKSKAFTLIELLVVVGIISLLVSILLPSLTRANELSRKVVCKTNIRLLQLGNEVYQQDNGGIYVAAAANMGGYYDPNTTNWYRWFGSRTSSSGPFTKEDGPLIPYLPGKAVRQCPSFRDFCEGFEAGCGGYGYNKDFVGQYVIKDGSWYRPADAHFDIIGNRTDAFKSPASTVAFTDSAFLRGGLIEYSFCESPRQVFYNSQNQPSIHFRHIGFANIVWLDCHVSEEKMTFSYEGGRNFAGHDIGWFGPDSNKLFDLE
ncbi:MAG: type II secretion system protein [Phycisphaerae bacterium]|nr:type II secretion system protein [Phycisphaerae bacterium]